MPIQAFLPILVIAGLQVGVPQPASKESDIIVTGKAKVTSDRLARANRFIRQVGILENNRQLARWVDPVCVHVIGVGEKYASIVERKVLDIAMNAGVQVSAGDCHPNIFISFTEDGAGLASAIYKRSARSLFESSSSERNSLLNGDAGIRWWYSTEVRGSDGRSLVSGPPVAAPTGGEGGGSVLPDRPTLATYSSSMVATNGIRAIVRSTAIIDIRKCLGLPLNSVADYVALVVLAEIHPKAPLPQNSVLGLFDRDNATQRLTDTDKAFLNALYRVALDRQSSQQRGAIAVAFAEHAE